MKTKNKILKIICSLLFLLFVVLDINLLTTPVYNGTYKGTRHNMGYYQNVTAKYSIKFYDNTYTEKRVSESYGDESTLYSYGFYRLEGKTVYLQLQGTDNLANRTEYKRKNVFCLVSNDVKYRCKKAIGLQVFYSIMKVSTASIVLTQIIKEKKRKS